MALIGADTKSVINTCKKKDGIMTVTNGIYLWPFLRNGFEITKGLSEVSVTNDEEYVPFIVITIPPFPS